VPISLSPVISVAGKRSSGSGGKIEIGVIWVPNRNGIMNASLPFSGAGAHAAPPSTGQCGWLPRNGIGPSRIAIGRTVRMSMLVWNSRSVAAVCLPRLVALGWLACASCASRAAQ